jgi:hypothetical protein
MPTDWGNVFLSLWLAHLLADFPFQTERTILAKRRLLWSGFAKHAAVHLALGVICLIVFTTVSLLWWRAAGVLLLLTAIHIASDYTEYTLRPGRSDSTRALVIDQAWHALTVAAAAGLLAGIGASEIGHAFEQLQAARIRLLPALVIYIAVIFGGGYLVRNLTKPLLGGFDSSMAGHGETLKELRNAGMYIGWLERFLVLSALALHSPATIGLILTAKSIVRFPELKDVRFAEYFLIGTLLSISVALIGGLILVWLLYGTIAVN